MASAKFKHALAADFPVLFVNIGWGTYYDGTETIVGNHSYIKNNAGAETGEAKAFVRNRAGNFQCGIGVGRVPAQRLHIVFVARNPADLSLRAVGIYVGAVVDIAGGNWGLARTSLAMRIPVERRPVIKGWPGSQGMRRWAIRDGETEHSVLLEIFKNLRAEVSRRSGLQPVHVVAAEDEDGHEGEVKMLLVRHRKREHRLRRKKITAALTANNGRLVCEVPYCGFDFRLLYGELGAGFAEVHHRKPLSKAPARGQKIKLSELSVVCANCHRMVHRNGQCRPLIGLIAGP